MKKRDIMLLEPKTTLKTGHVRGETDRGRAARNLGDERPGCRDGKLQVFCSITLVCAESTRGRCMLKVGDEAPDFDLEAVTSGRVHRVKLSDFRGRNVVIAFHPLDWTPT